MQHFKKVPFSLIVLYLFGLLAWHLPYVFTNWFVESQKEVNLINYHHNWNSFVKLDTLQYIYQN